MYPNFLEFTLVLSGSRLILAEIYLEDVPARKIVGYLLQSTIYTEFVYETIGIMIPDEGNIDWILGQLLYNNWTHPTIVINASQSSFESNVAVDSLWCFLEDSNGTSSKLEYIEQNSLLSRDGEVKFIYTSTMHQNVFLQENLELVWKWQILNYLFVYETDGSLSVLGYNPFNRTVLRVENRRLISQDKLSNMYGYKIISAMYDSVSIKVVKGVLTGEDVHLLNLIGDRLNATIEYLLFKTHPEVVRSVHEKSADLSFMKVVSLVSKTSLLNNPSYPVLIEYLVALVPTADLMPSYLYIFFTFEAKLWLYFLLATSAVTLLNVAIAKHLGEDGIEAALRIYSVLLSSACTHLCRAYSWTRIFIASWTLFSLLIVTGFTSELVSSLTTPRYYKGIQSAEDLLETGMEVLIATNFLNGINTFDKLTNYLKPTTFIVKKITLYQKDRAFITSLSYAQVCASKLDINGRAIYKVLKDRYVALHRVYDFTKDSPYKDKIEELLSLCKEFGLGYFRETYDVNYAAPGAAKAALSMENMRSVFYIYILCCLCCLISFGMEVGYSKLIQTKQLTYKNDLYVRLKKF